MAFVTNDNQQLTLTDSTLNLTQREKRVLEKSWAKTFAEKVFPAIDESIFSVLYSDKASRPNTLALNLLNVRSLRGCSSKLVV